MFAALEVGGKQYRVTVGSVIKVEKLEGEVGQVVELGNVLAAAKHKIGSDLSKVVVKAEILEHCKTDKVIVFKKKRRHNYRRKRGHRQNISVLRVKEIVA
ncbi:MAG: 50S ribosomal protein L21 [Proteobacteria bacterium]|nr:50S ribosomal protein L21 [Pseudomonadota bacterium]